MTKIFYPKKARSWSKAILTGLFMSAIAVGCGKSGGGSASSPPPPPPLNTIIGNQTGCSGCPGNSGFLASAVGIVAANGIQLGLNFYGDAASINQNANYGSSSSYYGWIGATGTMVVNPGDICAPPGTYNVQTQQPGTLSGQSIQGLTLVAQGPTQVVLYIPSAYLTSTVPPSNGLGGNSFGLQNNAPFRLQGGLITQPVGVQQIGNPYGNGYIQPGSQYYGQSTAYCQYYAPYIME